MRTFEQWFNENNVAVTNQNTKRLMKAAYNSALEAASEIAQQEYDANNLSNVVPRSGDAAAANIKSRIGAFMDREYKL